MINACTPCPDSDCRDCPVVHCTITDEHWTIDELIDHSNGCEEQIDYLLAEIEVKDKRIKELEGEIAELRNKLTGSGLAQ
jgi:hypothetical protein